jgi:hypothetical protein
MLRRFLVPVITSMLIAAPIRAEEKLVPKFLKADNGLGAVAAANLGLYLGDVAFGSRPAWQGYDLGPGDTLGGGFQLSGDCASSNGGAIAKALVAPQAAEPPEGVIRLGRAGPIGEEGEKTFDMKAIYQSGQAFNCPTPQR